VQCSERRAARVDKAPAYATIVQERAVRAASRVQQRSVQRKGARRRAMFCAPAMAFVRAYARTAVCCRRHALFRAVVLYGVVLYFHHRPRRGNAACAAMRYARQNERRAQKRLIKIHAVCRRARDAPRVRYTFPRRDRYAAHDMAFSAPDAIMPASSPDACLPPPRMSVISEDAILPCPEARVSTTVPAGIRPSHSK